MNESKSSTASSQPDAEPKAALLSLPPLPSPPGKHIAPVWLRWGGAALVLVAFGLLGWQWWSARSHLQALQQDMAQGLKAGNAVALEGRTLAKQGQESLLDLQRKLGVLEAVVADSQSQQQALQAAVQDFTGSRDERILADIDQTLTLTAQQLQLSGNAQAAIIALQSADSRLASLAAQAQVRPLRTLIARDIAALKALPVGDVPGIVIKLENIASSVDKLPLMSERRPALAKAAEKKTILGLQSKNAVPTWLDNYLTELGNLLRVERIENDNPVLLAPNQAYFLRENLKLRLINARLSLISRDGAAFAGDMKQAERLLGRYFDTSSPGVQAALSTVRSLAATDISRELPTLSETLNALRGLKLVKGGR